jgi:hypothetical protein
MPAPDQAEFLLPIAETATYLEWVRYWRHLEELMHEHPALEEYATERSAPFLRDPIADWISETMVESIRVQACDALVAGMWHLAPSLLADPMVLGRAVDYVELRTRWLEGDGIHRALGIAPPVYQVSQLRHEFVRTLRMQLAALGVGRGLRMPPADAREAHRAAASSGRAP